MIALLILLSLPTFAADKECFRYALQGAVKTSPGKFILITHEGTQLERKFEFDHKDIPRIAPYAGKFLKGEFILPEADPVSGTKVLSVVKVDFAVSDPLQHERGMIKLGTVSCPKTP